MNKLNHIGYIKYAALGPIILTINSCITLQPDKPNIIYIFTDQQRASMMSCAGNRWLKTPAMDYIADNGIRFTRAYTANPVSTPARVAMMTGRFPGYFNDDKGDQVKENSGAVRIREISEEVKTTTLAAWLQRAGYDLIYGGKEHLPSPLLPKSLGFKDISDDERDELAKCAARFIKEKHEKPYFMMISLINPHDICYMAIRDFAHTDWDKRILTTSETELATLDKALEIPERISKEEFFARYCPPLPPNYEPQEGEPKALQYLFDQRPFRRNAREHYTDEDWRMHRWAYCRLTEVVDRQIQVILDALKESGAEENTLVIFSSDHGDMDAAHRLEHKTILYEESVNIPFAAMWKGKIPPARVDSVHLVSNCLDLLPTVCDYAGIKGTADERGRSLRPLFEGKKTEWRRTLGAEGEICRMVIDADKYKYVEYDIYEDIEEQLFDLNLDPYETKHFTDDPKYASKLTELRKEFGEWFPSKR